MMAGQAILAQGRQRAAKQDRVSRPHASTVVKPCALMVSKGVRLSQERTEGPMQVRIMLQIIGDDGAVGDAEEVAALTKITERAEDLGLSLAESKTLLAAAQQRIVEAQVN